MLGLGSYSYIPMIIPQILVLLRDNCKKMFTSRRQSVVRKNRAYPNLNLSHTLKLNLNLNLSLKPNSKTKPSFSEIYDANPPCRRENGSLVLHPSKSGAIQWPISGHVTRVETADEAKISSN